MPRVTKAEKKERILQDLKAVLDEIDLYYQDPDCFSIGYVAAMIEEAANIVVSL